MLQIQQALPGHWLAATTPGRLVVLECANPRTEVVEDVWTALTDGSDGQSMLDHVTRGGILAAPQFALITWDGASESTPGTVRFIVRGSLRITIHSDSGQRQLSADGVSTWLEQLIDRVTGFRVDVAEEPIADSEALLPLGTGAAWVSSVRIGASIPSAPAVADVQEEPAATSVETATPEQPVAVDEPVAASEDTIAEETIAGPSALSSAVGAGSPEPHSTGIEATAAEATVGGYIDATLIRSASERSVADVGDHDGMTVMSGDIHKMRAAQAQSPAQPQTAAHPQTAAQPQTEPEHFVLKIDGRPTEQLNDLALVGRAPSVSKVPGGRVPKLITVGSADQDISRNHVQIAVEGDTVVVTDLHSRNGTLIVLPGKPPQKLRQGEPTSVIVGTVVDLGGGVTMTVGQE